MRLFWKAGVVTYFLQSGPRSGAIQPLFGPAMGNKARIETKPDPISGHQTINSKINKES